MEAVKKGNSKRMEVRIRSHEEKEENEEEEKRDG